MEEFGSKIFKKGNNKVTITRVESVSPLVGKKALLIYMCLCNERIECLSPRLAPPIYRPKEAGDNHSQPLSVLLASVLASYMYPLREAAT